MEVNLVRQWLAYTGLIVKLQAYICDRHFHATKPFSNLILTPVKLGLA
jgi:hypothetical protein